MVKIQICIKMIEMVLFHHHSSIYNEDWSKPGFGWVCSNPRYIYYSGFIMVLNMIRSYALTAPTHLDMVHTTLSTELQNAGKTNATHSIQYDLATGRSQKRSLTSTMHQKFTDNNINS